MKKISLFLFAVTIFLSLPSAIFASTTNGTIDSTYKYAWSDQIGWINFAPTSNGTTYAGLIITDSSVTGYAWSKEYGWINFGPFQNNTDGGVKNTSAGVLSGYAWSKSLGWINFSGVVISMSGQFTGKAQGDLVGTINFDLTQCTNCGVETDWRPINFRESYRGGNNYTPTFPASVNTENNNQNQSSDDNSNKITFAEGLIKQLQNQIRDFLIFVKIPSIQNQNSSGLLQNDNLEKEEESKPTSCGFTPVSQNNKWNIWIVEPIRKFVVLIIEKIKLFWTFIINVIK